MKVGYTLNDSERTSGSGGSFPLAMTGRISIFGGLLWAVAIVIEYSQHLQPPSDGALFYIDQLMFVVALGCWATAVSGLRRAAAAGHGWGRHTLTAWAVGYVLVAAGTLFPTVLNMFIEVSASAYDDNPLRPIGGALAILASAAAGVAIVRAHRFAGWSRWVVLGFAVYVFGFLFVPLFFGIGVDAVRETIWGLWWVVIGVVLLRYRPVGDGKHPDHRADLSGHTSTT